MLKTILRSFTVVAAIFATQASATEMTLKPLGKHPLCEASAVVAVKCPGSENTCLLVGDNEQRKDLFLFDVNQDHLENQRPVRFEALISEDLNDDRELSDIEALAKLPDGELIVFGSHSRNNRCKARKKRRIYLHTRLNPDGTLVAGSVEAVQSKKPKCDRLFGDLQSRFAEQICQTIEETEEIAGEAEHDDDKNICAEDPSFNLEGAVAVTDQSGDTRVWIGLRAPLIRGKALLLQQKKKRKSFSFTAAVLLDLGGLAVRDLTVADGTVWGISGAYFDSGQAHQLWRFPVSQLQPDATIVPETVALLPPSSEGLAIVGNLAFVLTDGAEPKEKDAETCDKPSSYVVIDLAGL